MSYNFTETFEFREDELGSGDPHKWPWEPVVVLDELVEFRSVTESNDHARITRLVIKAKQRSTWLTQEPNVGVCCR